MKYMGGKHRLAKHLLPIILQNKNDSQWYVEPFCGACSLIEKVSGFRIANDKNEFLIGMYLALQNGWIPPENIECEEYNNIRTNKLSYNPALVGFTGFGCSYGGKWFGGYARGKTNKGEPRNYCLETKKSLVEQAPKIKDVLFSSLDYQAMQIPDGSIIYCDPPYYGTTKYKNGLNYNDFWNWVREKSKKNSVYVSEYNAPDDFECLWSMRANSSLTKETGSKKAIEKLFRYKGHETTTI